MRQSREQQDGPFWYAIVATLRITVALQCVGNWRWLTQLEETPLLGWLLNPADVGGLGWDESTALALQQGVGWLALVAVGFVLCRPCAAVVAPLFCLQVAMATAMWQIDDGFPLDVAWLSPRLTRLFPYATQAARIAAPLALLILDPWKARRPLRQSRIEFGMNLLRWAAAVTFVAHGLEAWQHHAVFVDLLITSAANVLGVDVSQSQAESILSLVGLADFAVGFACVTTRWRAILLWMTIWGAATAASRTLAYDWDSKWHALATRAPHVGVPLAVVIYWQWLSTTDSGSSASASELTDAERSG